MRADRLVLVNRSRKTAEVVEQEEIPVAPGLKRVQSVLEDRERLDLPEELEVCACNAGCVLWNYLDADRPEQVGPKGHDVTACVDHLDVRVDRDGGRVVRNEGMDEPMFQTRLVVHLVFDPYAVLRG